MHDMKNNPPERRKELLDNMSVTNSLILFVSIETDHAHKNLIKLVKINSGIVVISNNANARQRFFMVTPEISCVAKDFKSISHGIC